MPFYDTKDDSHYVTGMKIIPLQTSDLRSILMTQKKYSELYPKYEMAYQKDITILPVSWYETWVKEKTRINSLDDDQDMVGFINELMESDGKIDLLYLTKKFIEKYGERFCLMRAIDWYHVVRDYLSGNKIDYAPVRKEDISCFFAAESNE